MEIKYKTSKTEEHCTNLKKAQKKYGEAVAEKLHGAINFIESASNLKDVREHLPFRFHDLKGDREKACAIDLGRKIGWRLLVVPLKENGSFCTNDEIFGEYAVCIKIIRIEEVSNHYE